MTRFRLAGALLIGLGAGIPLLWIALGGSPAELLRKLSQVANDPAQAPADKLYTCSMHPQIVRDRPGQCPICGMTLTAMENGRAEPEHVATRAAETGPEPGAVQVSQGFLQNFGIRTAEVTRGRLSARIRTVGYLDQNEATVVSANTKVGGWIEHAKISTVGERVEQGDLLFEIYSPELIVAQQEYLSATAYADRLRTAGAYARAVERAESLVLAATERLRSWGLTDSQIGRLARTGEAGRTVEFYAPASGYVVEKLGDSLEGMRLEPGMTVVKIADHSTLWAKVEFYERHIQDLHEGLSATITLDAYPERNWHGKILFFQPAMNPHTQTLTGFVEVANADGLLRPKMYATVEIGLPRRRELPLVPAQSVLHSGERSVVIVDRGNGTFLPRRVTLGLESDGRWEVLGGVSAGERVVTSSQFLIDSESHLRSAITTLLNSEDQGAAHQGNESAHRH